MHADACGGQRAPDPLELELQAVVSHLAWVLGTKPGSSVGTASTSTTALALWPVIVHILLYALKNYSSGKGFPKISKGYMV